MKNVKSLNRFLVAAWLLLGGGALAQTPVTLSVRDATGLPFNFKTVFTPQSIYGYSYPGLVYGGGILCLPTNGVVTTNLNEGPYTITFVGVPKTLHVYVPGLWATNIPGETLPVNLAEPRWQVGAFQFLFVQTNYLTSTNTVTLAIVTNQYYTTNFTFLTNTTLLTNTITVSTTNNLTGTNWSVLATNGAGAYVLGQYVIVVSTNYAAADDARLKFAITNQYVFAPTNLPAGSLLVTNGFTVWYPTNVTAFASAPLTAAALLAQSNYSAYLQAQHGANTNSILITGGTGTFASANGTNDWNPAFNAWTNLNGISQETFAGVISVSGVSVSGSGTGYAVGGAQTNFPGISGTPPATAFFSSSFNAGANMTITDVRGAKTFNSTGGGVGSITNGYIFAPTNLPVGTPPVTNGFVVWLPTNVTAFASANDSRLLFGVTNQYVYYPTNQPLGTLWTNGFTVGFGTNATAFASAIDLRLLNAVTNQYVFAPTNLPVGSLLVTNGFTVWYPTNVTGFDTNSAAGQAFLAVSNWVANTFYLASNPGSFINSSQAAAIFAAAFPGSYAALATATIAGLHTDMSKTNDQVHLDIAFTNAAALAIITADALSSSNRADFQQAQHGTTTGFIWATNGTSGFSAANGLFIQQSFSAPCSWTNVGATWWYTNDARGARLVFSGTDGAGALGGWPVASAYTNINISGTPPATSFFTNVVTGAGTVTVDSPSPGVLRITGTGSLGTITNGYVFAPTNLPVGTPPVTNGFVVWLPTNITAFASANDSRLLFGVTNQYVYYPTNQPLGTLWTNGFTVGFGTNATAFASAIDLRLLNAVTNQYVFAPTNLPVGSLLVTNGFTVWYPTNVTAFVSANDSRLMFGVTNQYVYYPTNQPLGTLWTNGFTVGFGTNATAFDVAGAGTTALAQANLNLTNALAVEAIAGFYNSNALIVLTGFSAVPAANTPFRLAASNLLFSATGEQYYQDPNSGQWIEKTTATGVTNFLKTAGSPVGTGFTTLVGGTTGSAYYTNAPLSASTTAAINAAVAASGFVSSINGTSLRQTLVNPIVSGLSGSVTLFSYGNTTNALDNFTALSNVVVAASNSIASGQLSSATIFLTDGLYSNTAANFSLSANESISGNGQNTILNIKQSVKIGNNSQISNIKSINAVELNSTATNVLMNNFYIDTTTVNSINQGEDALMLDGSRGFTLTVNNSFFTSLDDNFTSQATNSFVNFNNSTFAAINTGNDVSVRAFAVQGINSTYILKNCTLLASNSQNLGDEDVALAFAVGASGNSVYLYGDDFVATNTMSASQVYDIDFGNGISNVVYVDASTTISPWKITGNGANGNRVMWPNYAGTLTLFTNITMPSVLAGTGQFAMSNNGDLYWVTATKTNLAVSGH